jgi:TonB-linked SusC/RagA family outer membrane protein
MKYMFTKLLRRDGPVLAVLLALILMSFSAAAQQQVTGKVVDATGQGMPGVNIVIKNTSKGTTSDQNGDFTIEASATDILTFSFIGYRPYEVNVGNQTSLRIELAEDVETLNEVVVIGYGEVKKSDLMGAVSSVKGKTLNESVITGVDQGLIGRVAGVSATQMSGQPGSSVSIRIRGASSINGDTEPLYVVDGVPISGNNPNVYNVGLGAVGGGGKTTYSPLSTINPNDIESIEVLKDAAATAIYGNRGTNGVVMITTKRGKKGESKLNYEGYYGVQEVPKMLDVMNLREYAEFRNDWAAETAGETPDPLFADPSLLGEGTNWQKEIFQTAPIMNHQLSFSGGDKTRYYISGGYFKQDGIIIGSSFDRYSLRVNMDTEVKSWLRVGNSLLISKTDERLGAFDRYGVISTAVKARPDVPARNFDGSYAGVSGEGAFVNPIAQALDKENYLKRAGLNGSLYVDATIVRGLTFRTEFGGNGELVNSSAWNPTYNYGGGAVNNQNSIQRQSGQSYSWYIRNYFTYTHTFNTVHNVTAMLGQEANEFGWQSLQASGRDLPVNDVHSIDLGDPKSFLASDALNSSASASYYTRVYYNYSEKYYLGFVGRIDGHSNFADGNRWGSFPSLSAKWRISGEQFMSGVSVIDDLSLSASWGQTGNAGSRAYIYGETLATMPTNLGLGFRYSNFANPEITWESAAKIDVGLNAVLFAGRLNATLNYYNNRITNLFLAQQLPGYMGTTGNPAVARSAPYGNFGEMENTGIEIAIKAAAVKSGKFSWDIDFNLSKNKNKLLDIGEDGGFQGGYIGSAGDVLISKTEAGQPLGHFYGYKVVGVFQDKEDILNSPVQWTEVDNDGDPILTRDGSVWPGDLKFADIDANDTIDIRDRVDLGSPLPKFSFGLTNTFRYAGIELSIFMSGNYGNKIFNAMKMPAGSGLTAMRSAWDNQLNEVTGRAQLQPISGAVDGWYDDIDNVMVSNTGTRMPRATFSDPNQNNRVSDRYIEDGSYLRIRNITLAYNFPKVLADKIKASDLRVYVQVQNAYTFTKYSGMDPEVGQDTWDPNLFGVDNGRYPSPRIYSFGLNVGF